MSDTPQLKAGRARRWNPWRERFEANVDRTAGYGPWGDCHLWTGCTRGERGNEYGVIEFDGHAYGVHRVAFFLRHHQWPRHYALHLCDVKLCVNADHIYDGTHSDNMRDAVERGQHRAIPRPGASNPAAKLTWRQVRAIRRAYPRATQTALAARYGVDRATIGYIVRGDTWKEQDER